MTTIAYDGKTLAGDRQSTFAGTPARTRKVFRTKEYLFGCAGDTGDCQAYVRWALGKEKQPPLSNVLILVIDRRMRIWCATEKMNWYQIGATFWAIGSGANYALAAMHAGKSAEEAIRIASNLDTATGLGVDAVRFK